MPAYAALNAQSPVDSKNSFDYFQRKKVGSIRDNPKLLKIRQQFENACRESSKSQKKSSSASSAPCSFSLSPSKNSGTFAWSELLNINSKFSSKTQAFIKSQLDTTQNRRHSEGEVEECSSLKIFSRGDSFQSGCTSSGDLRTSNLVSGSEHCDSKSIDKKIEYPKKDSGSSSDSGIHPNSSASEEDITSHSNFSSGNSNESGAPPIPRRGISPAVQKALVHSKLGAIKKNILPSKELISSLNTIKPSNVQKAIQIYEGMSSADVKKSRGGKCPNQRVVRKESHEGRKSNIPRRSSRRNSMRKTKVDHKEDSSKISSQKTSISSKDDSGVVYSDEDKSQSIYQTLSTVVNVTPDHYDPYDRLSRLHDVVTRIHKGQSSTCAACKAIPSSVLQYRSDEASLLQVKCNEIGPHHHPPCICFSCQHSIFSCSVDNEITPDDHDNDSLYYNVCCLNSPNRESWRQSRRRPVCEQNGRLCIVNCDIEQRESGGRAGEVFYEKLCEWHSTPSELSRRRHLSKPMSGDSCDSDEGWVDVTDSEDEKNLLSDKSDWSISRDNSSRVADEQSIVQNFSYDVDRLISKCVDLDLSRAASTEHLYESIADIESQNESNLKDDDVPPSSNGSSTLSLKSEQNPENDLDSGEWSTESASPVFDESSNKTVMDTKTSSSSSSNQYRFTVNLECQETTKKTFMKSVLGKKAMSPKKRRMSNFFVPWLVSNQEYGPSSAGARSPKSCLKKQGGVRCQAQPSKSSPCKNKRSQSIPSGSPKMSMSCTKALFSSVEVLDKCKSKATEQENCSNKFLDSSYCLSPDTSQSSSRGSIASSAYLRADQLQTSSIVKPKCSVSSDAPVDVNVERISKKSPCGDSEHSYILFQPVKEEEVPLYQFYERNIKERVSFCRSPPSMSPIMWSSVCAESGGMNGETTPKSARQAQLSVLEQLSPDAKDMKMLWCELPEVKDSGILERISAQELKLQEAAFEFIQSQASYIRSLKVLYENFIRTTEFSDTESSACVLSKHEHDVLFSDIIRVKEASERLMYDLTTRWSDGILIPDICDIIQHHAVMPTFSVYVRYCSNRVYQERTLKELKETRLCFLEVLRKLESNPACQGLSLESFLFLPMQHIARLPLLLDNIFRWLVPESPSYGICKKALEAVHKIFIECNEGARKMERLEEMFVLNKQLEFKDCKAVPLISASRWLLKKGELMKLEFEKKTLGRSSRCVRVPVYIFLFNDLLVVTKRKSEDSYMVVDYCARDKVQAMVVNPKDLQQPVVVPNTCRYLIYLTLFNNHQGCAVDMILNCALLSERTRWIEAIQSVPQNKPCEIWEYDCPQVQCVRTYIAQQPDELSLQDSDVVTIHRKMNDGWYEGRRLRDGLQGWFPASYTMDIPCSRARASNLRQCYRLLMLSQTQ